MDYLSRITEPIKAELGQFIYLGANALSLTRCFVLGRPIADKVKDCCMLGITCGLILIKFFGGIHS